MSVGTKVFNREWRAHGDGGETERVHLSVVQVEEIKALKATGRWTLGALSGRFGVSTSHIRDVLAGSVEGAPVRPPCMDDEEWTLWTGAQELPRFKEDGRIVALSACHDCMPAHALEMRAAGRCNGHPRGVEPDEDEPDEPAPAITPKEIRPMKIVRVALQAPCGSCIHAAVCNRRAAIARVQSAAVDVTDLPEGLTVEVVGSIDCDAYAKVKGASHHATTGRPPQSLEQRQASSVRMKAIRARQRAEREQQIAAGE
jgi:hypothetical protein